MATDNSLQIKITADVADAQKALTSISKLSKTAKSSLDMLGSSALGVSNAFAKMGGTTKELNAFKSMGKSNFLGLKTAQKDILNTQKAIEKLGKKGVSVGRDIEKSFNKAFKSLDKMSKNGTIKIRVEEPKSKKESNNDNNRGGNKLGGIVGVVIGANSGAIGNKVFREIAHLQEKRARVSAWNLSKAQQRIWDRQVRQLLKDNSLITEADAESMMMAAASSIGHYDPHIVGKTVASATKYAQMERAMGYNKSNIDDIAKNYYGVAEARQVANDVEKTLKTFETVFRITTTSSGKITVADVETILRNLGPGAATLSDEGLLRLLAYAEQIKVAGRGQSGSTGAGISTVGTTTKMLQLMAMGKPSALGAKRMIAELGIMDDEVYRIVGDRVELALENVSEEAEKQNADERAIAREIFERGEFGQVLGKYVIGSDLARAGVYDKQLAQTDPVKWVQNLMPLIKQYTASESKRGSYYGQKGLEANRAGMTTEEFMKTLNESDYLSAITSFWARTGLSQRVINAFSIFSNEAFQHRSAAMLQTAVNQKDVTALQLEQIENGNLNIAFLKAQTSLNNFIQAFEPFGAIVGKATYYLSGFLDILGQWARDYPFLSNFLASWGALKTAQLGGRSFLEFYGYLNDNKKKTGGQEASKKRRKSSSAKDTPSNARDAKKVDNNQAVPYFVGLENRAKKASTNIKNAFANMIPKIASLFNKIGFYGMLGSFAYTLADMTIEYLGWGDKFRSWWDSIVSFVNENPLSLSLRFDQNKYRSKEDNQRIADIDKEIAEREDYNASRRQSDDLSLEEMKQMSENETRIKALKAERKTLSTRTSTTIGQLKPLLQSVEGVFKDKKYLENVQKFVDANAKLGDTVKQFNTQSDYFKTYISDEQKGEGKDAQSAFDTAYGNLKDQTKQTTDAFDEVKKSLVFEGEDLDKIQRFEDAVNSLSGMGDQLEPIATNLSQLMSVMLGFDVDSDYVSYMIKNKKFSVQGIANSRVFDLENQAAAQQAMSRDYYEQGAKRKYRQSTPDIVPGATLNDVASYAEKIKKDLTKASAVSSQRYAFDTDEEVMKQARATVLSDAMAGKLGADFQEWRSFYFKDNVDEAALKRGGYTNEEDYNFNRKVNGYSLNDLTKLQAQKLRLSKYNSTFGSLGIQSEDMLLESQRNLARAQASTTAVGEAGLPNQTYQTSLQDLFQLQAQLSASGVRNAQQNEALSQRRLAILNQTFAQALQLERQYNDNAEQTMLEGLTDKERQQWEYARQAELTQATFNAVRQSMEDSYNRWVANNQTASDEEKLQKQQEYEKRSLELQEAYNKEQQRQAEEAAKAQNEIDMTPLGNKIEQWQDVNLHMQTLQNEFMEGFVEANEKWLDGDEDAWKEYGNNLLKTWRNIVLKMGYSKLLGGIAETATAGIGTFLSGVFGLPAPSITGTSEDTSSTSAQTAQNSSGYGFGKSIYEFFAGNGKDGESGFDKLTEKLKSAFTTSVDWLKDLFDNFDFSKFGSGLMDIFSGLGSKIGDFLSNIDFSSIGNAFSSMGSSIASGASSLWSSLASIFTYADGGIMTSSGPLPLHTYASGGIAKSAQVAVFGEGSTPEAYVPLPDGRSIPVTMNGGGTEAGGNNISISINVVNNQGSTSESQSTTDSSSNMNKLANNIKSLVKQEIVNQSRPGGLLYNNR